MKQLEATVISNETAGVPPSLVKGRRVSEYRLTWLKCPDIVPEAKPGQFLMVEGGDDCTLRRPLSIHRVNGDTLALYYAVWADGSGTSWLASRKPGDTVDLLGPLGNGFTIPLETGSLLLIAGGMGIAPLTFLAEDACKSGHKVTLLAGAQTASQLLEIPNIDGLKVVTCTEDGTSGYRGLVTEILPEYIDNVDGVYVCGPQAMYRAMAADKARLFAGKPVQVSLEVRMGCGSGICFSCTIRTRNGLKQVCKDGPVFDFDDIIWDGVAC
jgi:dihydroorotate dehydrogenase electron transfer subunit